MNPEHADIRGTAQNPDVYFQNREACNRYYDALPDIVEKQMARVAALTGREIHPFDYVGSPTARSIIISMGSSCEVIEETVEYLNTHGYNVGAVKVRLYRPFDAKRLLAAIPGTVDKIAVLDRTKEPGAIGEPLFTDVACAIQQSGRAIKVIGGRYGLSSKEFDPTMVKAVYDHLDSSNPFSGFTVGINDDVTHLSLPAGNPVLLSPDGMTQAQFYGIVPTALSVPPSRQPQSSATLRNITPKPISNTPPRNREATLCRRLRISESPVKSEYSIEMADYVACNKDTYVNRFEPTCNLKSGGIFVLASPWSVEQMDAIFPASLKRDIARRGIKFYNVDASAIAQNTGLGVRINTIMETVFFKLMPVIPFDKAYAALQERIRTVYRHEGNAVVESNLNAIAQAVSAITKIEVPAGWVDAVDSPAQQSDLPPFVANVAQPCLRREGNDLPVSLMSPDGFTPTGTTAYEKRRIARFIPHWDVDKCVECTECSLVCAHASIRPYLLDATERAAAPAGIVTKEGHGAPVLHDYQYRIQVYPEDCTGCSSCAVICPGEA